MSDLSDIGIVKVFKSAIADLKGASRTIGRPGRLHPSRRAFGAPLDEAEQAKDWINETR
jgi:hypothetical protein